MYILVFILSLISCFVGFALESTQRNIRHVENGRVPNAGAALFPHIPFAQATYFLAAWGINKVHEGAGFSIVCAYAALSIGVKFVAYRKASAQLKALVESSRNLSD